MIKPDTLFEASFENANLLKMNTLYDILASVLIVSGTYIIVFKQNSFAARDERSEASFVNIPNIYPTA